MSFFVEYAEDKKFLIKVLTILVAIQSVIIMILGVFAVRQRVLYINPSQVIGTAYVGQVPDETAGFFGMTFLHFIGNANQHSAFEQTKAGYLLMSSQLQSAMKTSLEAEVDQIKKSDMSIQTTPLTYSVTRDGESYKVDVTALRVSFVFGQPVTKENRVYSIKCRKTRTTKSNPFGLEVTSYEYKVVEESSNEKK